MEMCAQIVKYLDPKTPVFSISQDHAVFPPSLASKGLTLAYGEDQGPHTDHFRYSRAVLLALNISSVKYCLIFHSLQQAMKGRA